MASIIATNTDLIERLLKCSLTTKERTFLKEQLNSPTMTIPQFDWMHSIARRHKKKLQTLKKAT